MLSSSCVKPLQDQLRDIFEEINSLHFGGKLALPILRWNSRLRTSAGRFMPGGRSFFSARPPAIEVASYLLEELESEALVRDTIGHEMIHYWLWVSRRPYGHTPEFFEKMRSMGVSRYNPVPRRRKVKYLYVCPSCQTQFPARKRLRQLACASCCKKYSGGAYDKRFRLVLSSPT